MFGSPLSNMGIWCVDTFHPTFSSEFFGISRPANKADFQPDRLESSRIKSTGYRFPPAVSDQHKAALSPSPKSPEVHNLSMPSTHYAYWVAGCACSQSRISLRSQKLTRNSRVKAVTMGAG